MKSTNPNKYLLHRNRACKCCGTPYTIADIIVDKDEEIDPLLMNWCSKKCYDRSVRDSLRGSKR